ncbi:MAG: GNAT family N-acetyltransferase [Chloroflexi bacterium]|nr:GNAT family N-acetyltransferase [Chloroflexota bacterium]
MSSADALSLSKNGHVLLRGEKIIVREKLVADALDDYTWSKDPELSRYDAVSPVTCSFAEFLLHYVREMTYPIPSQRRFAIDTQDGRHIGNCMYYDIDRRRRQAQLGILIGDRAYWKQGYGTDSVVTFLRHVFTTTNLDRVYLRTLDWNLPAQRCFERCGFVPYDRVCHSENTFILMETRRSSFLEAYPQPDG